MRMRLLSAIGNIINRCANHSTRREMTEISMHISVDAVILKKHLSQISAPRGAWDWPITAAASWLPMAPASAAARRRPSAPRSCTTWRSWRKWVWRPRPVPWSITATPFTSDQRRLGSPNTPRKRAEPPQLDPPSRRQQATRSSFRSRNERDCSSNGSRQSARSSRDAPRRTRRCVCHHRDIPSAPRRRKRAFRRRRAFPMNASSHRQCRSPPPRLLAEWPSRRSWPNRKTTRITSAPTVARSTRPRRTSPGTGRRTGR